MPYILLVEDNQMNADMVIRILSSANLEVRHALKGLEGAQMARKDRPDLILMDFDLPDVDGRTMALVLKKQLGGDSAPPIVAVTARSGDAEMRIAQKFGCVAFVSKPFVPEEFLSLVKSLLAKNAKKETTTVPAASAPIATAVPAAPAAPAAPEAPAASAPAAPAAKPGTGPLTAKEPVAKPGTGPLPAKDAVANKDAAAKSNGTGPLGVNGQPAKPPSANGTAEAAKPPVTPEATVKEPVVQQPVPAKEAEPVASKEPAKPDMPKN